MKKLFISKFALLASLFVVAFTANAQVDFPVPNNQTTPTDVAPSGTSPSGDTPTDVEPSDTNPSDVMPTDVDARAVPPTPTVNVSEMCGQVDFQITNYDAAPAVPAQGDRFCRTCSRQRAITKRKKTSG